MSKKSAGRKILRNTPSAALTLLAIFLLNGCALKAIYVHPEHEKQEELNALVDSIQLHTGNPDSHYWVRVSKSSENPEGKKESLIGLLVLKQRHIYLSEDIVKNEDDSILTCILAHGMAHHELSHHTKRKVVHGFHYLAFHIGGIFVPFLGSGTHVLRPVVEAAMSTGQEFSADEKALSYIEPLGYTKDDYILALELLGSHYNGERTGTDSLTGTKDFSKRIRALKAKASRKPET